MGFDVCGLNPISDVGVYFQNNMWLWRPLWSYLKQVCDGEFEEFLKEKMEGDTPLLSETEYDEGTMNNGYTFNEAKALQFAELLTKEIETGNTKQYEIGYMKALDEAPLEACEYCEATGIRSWECNMCGGTGQKSSSPDMCEKCGGRGWIKKTCNGCLGKGKVKPSYTDYPFSEENVKEFVEFLNNCGGFRIS